jgi:hypothetical protein
MFCRRFKLGQTLDVTGYAETGSDSHNEVKPRFAMATHVSYDDYVMPELVAEKVRYHWKGPFQFGASDMVVNMTKDRIGVRDGVVTQYPTMSPPPVRRLKA